MARKNKYKIEIAKAYHIAIVDKDGNEVDSDWSFLDYKESKKQAEKMLAKFKPLESEWMYANNKSYSTNRKDKNGE